MLKKRVLVCAMLLCLLMASHAGAQTFSGAQITGVVKDQSGAFLPGVTITAKNAATSLSRTTLSNENGVYTLPSIPIGTYDVTAELSGFQVQVRKDVVLQIGDNLRVNFDLSVGQVTDQITVTGEVPTVQSESAALGTVINNRTVTEMPLNGRVFYDLVSLVAGAVAPAPGSTLANRGGVNIAGARDTSNSFTLDGIDNGSNGTNGPQIKLSIEMMQEFKVLTNSYSPEYGRASGGNVVMTTRLGTNEYRGTLWEFVRNSALDAKNLFDPPDCTATTQGQRCGGKPPLRRNQFGGVLGGPVPKIDNLFFFLGYEGTRHKQALTSVATVPIEPFHRGDFSSLRTVTLRDPLTGQAFANNIIPPSRWDPIGAAFLDLYPLPTNALASNNLVTNPIKEIPNDQATGRLDYIRGKNSYYVRHIWNREGLREPFPGRGTTNGIPGFGWDDPLVGNNFTAGAAFVFSPKMIGNVRYGLNAMKEPNINRNLVPYNQQIGLCCTSAQTIFFGRPSISVSGYNGVGDNQATPGLREEYTNEINYTQSILTGNHNLMMGSNLRIIHIDHHLPNARRGNFNFDGSLSGNAIADMLLGLPRQSQFTPDTANLRTHQRGRNPSIFFNDDWKVTSNLTVNLGVRWEFSSPMQDGEDAIASFDFDSGKINVPDVSKITPGSIAPNLVQNSPYGRGLRHTAYKNFQPRVGMAYSLNSRTVVRSGYGIYVDVLSFGNAQQTFVQNSPWFPTKTYRVDSTTGPAISLSRNPFPDNIFTLPLLNLAGWDPDFQEGYVQNWNLSVQRQLLNDLTLETAYLGSKGTKLMLRVNVNQPYPVGGLLGSGSQQSRRPYPSFGTIERAENSGDSNFHALSLKLERRFTAGISLLGTYLWSKSIDNASGQSANAQDVRNLAAQRGVSDYDARHRNVTSVIYELPVGKGHRFLSSGAAGAILGGWQLSGILTFQSGRPVTPVLSIDNSNTGAGSTDRPNLIGDPNSGPKEIGNFWNRNALAIAPPNTFGNAGRNTLLGPGMRAFDFSMIRNIPFGSDGKRKAQFRAEAFNVLNHPMLGQPIATFNTANFGTITGTLVNTSARQIQLALKVLF